MIRMKQMFSEWLDKVYSDHSENWFTEMKLSEIINDPDCLVQHVKSGHVISEIPPKSGATITIETYGRTIILQARNVKIL